MAVNGDTAGGAVSFQPIFSGVVFTIIESPDWQQGQALKLIAQLQESGATHRTVDSSDLQDLTHIISTTIDFPAYNDAIDGYIHVVKPQWVGHSISKNRAANPRQYSPDPCLYLSDVIVTCADDIPQGDKDAILGGVNAAGGQYSPVLTKLVTHVVALSMSNVQCKTLVDKKLRCSPVLPHWFDDCLKLGKKIDARPYLLPNPLILSSKRNDPVKWKVSEDVNGASTPVPDESKCPPSPSKSRREFKVLKNKLVYLEEDLNLSGHLRNTLEGILEEGGAWVVRKVEDANVLICQYRDSSAYLSASRAGRDVGNLAWLYYIINHNAYTSPTRRLLHYPVPRNGISGFQHFTISVSNYTGEARVYLENLVKAAGGRFTKTMTQANTHLITAHQASEKCDAAKEWDINIINHLWLEESYAKCRIQSLTNTRYTHFPRRTNLGEVLGQCQIDRDAVETNFFPSSEPRPSSTKKNGQLKPVQNNNTDACQKATVSSPLTPRFKYLFPGKENEPPRSTESSRAAKRRATDKLRDQAPDIALFQKESKRVGGVVYGGRKVADSDRITVNAAPTGRKRHSNGEEVTPQSDTSTPSGAEDHQYDDTIKSKKIKTKHADSTAKNASYHLFNVLVTGYERWANKTAKELEDKMKLRAIGIKVVDVAGKHDVLVAPRILRTRKFVAGIANANWIVDISWLEQSIKKGRVLPPKDFQLKDAAREKDYGFRLENATENAEVHRAAGGMLRGWTIFCTEGVHGGFEAYEEIVRANKGRIMLWKGRDTKVPNITDDNGQLDNLFLLSGTTTADRALWDKFKVNAVDQGWTARIVKSDWIIGIATTQDVEHWDDGYLLSEEGTANTMNA